MYCQPGDLNPLLPFPYAFCCVRGRWYGRTDPAVCLYDASLDRSVNIYPVFFVHMLLPCWRAALVLLIDSILVC